MARIIDDQLYLDLIEKLGKLPARDVYNCMSRLLNSRFVEDIPASPSPTPQPQLFKD